MSIKSCYTAEVFSKVNLSLEITGKRDGLHTLKMLVRPFFGFKDIAVFVPENRTVGISDFEVTASFEGFESERFKSFCLPKAQRIAKELGIGGRIVIEKGVPLGAGLGGSSASVVAMLKAMCEYAKELGKSVALDNSFLLELGSDVPCMLYGKSCLVEGVGEIIKPVDLSVDSDDLYIEIASGGSDTKECYALYDKLKSENPNIDTSFCDGEDKTSDVCVEYVELDGARIKLFRNDLTLPATMLNKNIQKTIMENRNKYKCTFLSGSGSAVVSKINKL